MKNLYKSTDIFRCVHESHRGYKNRISAYHILKEKACFPDGCIYFRWKCKQLNKKKRCHKGFSHVGRNCFGCKYYYDQKIHNYPELQVSEAEYRNFLSELDEFEDWIEKYKFRPLNFSGTVSVIKPRFIQKIYPKSKYLSFRGYIIMMKNGFLGNESFDDPIYARISSNYFYRLNFGIGSEIDGIAQLRIDKGRLILDQLKNIEVMHRENSSFWNNQKVTIARETAVEFREQPENCVNCHFAALVELQYSDIDRQKNYPKRTMFCLKGMSHYKDCFVKAENFLADRGNECFPDTLLLSGSI